RALVADVLVVVGRSPISACGRPWMVARGRGSLMSTTPCPTNTPSSIARPSQTKVCDDCAAVTDDRPFLDFHERSERSHRGRRHERAARRGADIGGGELTAESLFTCACLAPYSLGYSVGGLRYSVERHDQSRTLGCDSMVADSTAAID